MDDFGMPVTRRFAVEWKRLIPGSARHEACARRWVCLNVSALLPNLRVPSLEGCLASLDRFSGRPPVLRHVRAKRDFPARQEPGITDHPATPAEEGLGGVLSEPQIFASVRAHAFGRHALIPARSYNAAVHVTIEMRKPGTTAWDLVGNFSATDAEIDELRDVLGGNEPYAVLHRVKHVLIFDTLDAIREEGFQARVQFHDDH